MLLLVYVLRAFALLTRFPHVVSKQHSPFFLHFSLLLWFLVWPFFVLINQARRAGKGNIILLLQTGYNCLTSKLKSPQESLVAHPPHFSRSERAAKSPQSITTINHTQRAIIKYKFIFHMFLFESVWTTKLQKEATWLKYLCNVTHQSIY